MIVLCIIVFILCIYCIQLIRKVKLQQKSIDDSISEIEKVRGNLAYLANHVKELTTQHNNLVSALDLESPSKVIIPFSGPIGKA